MRPRPRRRSTPSGQHRPVLLHEILRALDPKPGMTIVDCTIGWAGHSAEMLTRIAPGGQLIGLDLDADNLPKAQERLNAVGQPFHLHHANFAGLEQILASHGVAQVDALLADLGMSSMQVDDPARGFSYVRDGVLDMRMDRSRGRTAAQILATIERDELATLLRDVGDEPHADRIADTIVAARETGAITTTKQLAQVIMDAVKQKNWQLHPTPGKWNTHPAARTFQALRIHVNRELASLEHLLRRLPHYLKSDGVAAIISFHSGEDRLVKSAFRAGLAAGQYGRVSEDPIRPTFNERQENPRSRSAKLRCAWRSNLATSRKFATM